VRHGEAGREVSASSLLAGTEERNPSRRGKQKNPEKTVSVSNEKRWHAYKVGKGLSVESRRIHRLREPLNELEEDSNEWQKRGKEKIDIPTIVRSIYGRRGVFFLGRETAGCW